MGSSLFEVRASEVPGWWKSDLDCAVRGVCRSWGEFLGAVDEHFVDVSFPAIFADYRAIQVFVPARLSREDFELAAWDEVVAWQNRRRDVVSGPRESIARFFVRWFLAEFESVVDSGVWSEGDVVMAYRRFLENQLFGVVEERFAFEAIEDDLSAGFSVVWGSSSDELKDVDLWIVEAGVRKYPVSVKNGGMFDAGRIGALRSRGKTVPVAYVNSDNEWFDRNLDRVDAGSLRWFK